MRIAIQGHLERYKEVIDTLMNFGGINKRGYVGDDTDLCYYIDECSHIETQFISKIDENFYKCYTLEEFEKEFPFKVGDKVTVISNIAYRVIALEYYKGRLCYKLNNGLNYSSNTLTLYKEMKEERNITLTLDKAKEWYNKGGELKEIALQAFTKEELNPLPKSWEEFIELTKFTFNGNLEYINGIEYWSNGCLPNKSIGESTKIWNKYLALFKLEQLRDCYRQGWEPDWKDEHTSKYCIILSSNTLWVTNRAVAVTFLAFQSREVAEDFLKNFESLIKEAGDLI